ncbi:MAG: LytR family transcriptional regulator [Lachnospiraceae bacterium]|jgi:LCP family protein required for cell wall assembly|nr:LytR family transcriptional regulator [Lachnospiraceae bacterium]RKI81524.1 LytR family transcriptional regulator [bacterium 1xD42-87]
MAKRYVDDYDEDEVRPRKKSSGRKGSGKKKSGKKAQAKKQRRRIILFIVEIIILIIAVMVLYMVLAGTGTGKVELKEKDIIINETVQEAEETTMKGYRNIALFGVDSTTGALTKNTRSDTIMIASINQDTGDCKLVSVYRDTYLNLSNDSYNKCNAAYAKGGPEQAINMLNMNLDMNITDFVTVGFAGLTDAIDALGGVDIEVDESEISHLNNYQLCIAEDLKREYTPVTETGRQRLDGLQATGYCRIRYTAGDDFKRAERQREVLSAVADQAKKASLPKLTETANSVFEEVYTSLDLSEIVDMLGDVGAYNITATDGFPQEDMRVTGTIGSKGSCVIPTSLEDNVKWLHKFLFDADNYEPSETVKQCSEKIYEETNGYLTK